jgi:hypothetical protein
VSAVRFARFPAVVLAASLLACATPAAAGGGAFQAGTPLPRAAQAEPAAATPATRAAVWRQLRAEKASRVHPYVPKRVEAFAVRFEDNILPRLATPRTGFFPFVGRITSGGGFAMGPGYRLLDVAGGDWTTYAAGSLKGYWQIDTRLTWSKLANGRGFATAYGRYFRFPREDFYGLGPESDRADRADFDLRQGTVGVTAGMHARPWLTVGGTTEYFRPRLGPGGDNKVPNATDVFGVARLPGWAEQHDFLRVEGYAHVQTAAPLLNPRKGGKYRVALARYADTSDNDDGFTRVDVDVQQYVSVLNERRVLAIRALGSFSDVAGDAEMPFYLMRTLGGGQTLRGFRDFRFRDRHLLALQAEYRFEILTALDGAIFYDAGMVAPRLEGFRLRDFERDWGFGFRFGGNGGVFLRLDLAYGGEGPRTWLRFGHVF